MLVKEILLENSLELLPSLVCSLSSLPFGLFAAVFAALFPPVGQSAGTGAADGVSAEGSSFWERPLSYFAPALMSKVLHCLRLAAFCSLVFGKEPFASGPPR